MAREEHVPEDPQDTLWDVAVIGTGAGGGSAGFALARSGRKVLFIDRGKRHSAGDQSVAALTQSERGIDAGWWPEPIRKSGDDAIGPSALVGCAVGGSTALNGMVM